MTHNRESLDLLAKEAARSFTESGTALTEAVAKLAGVHSLTDDQTATVCRFANHHVNRSQMAADSYTTFPLARPEDVTMHKSASSTFLADALPSFALAMDKEAGVADALADPGAFGEICAYFGVPFEMSGIPEEDARRLAKTAHLLNVATTDALQMEKAALSSAEQGVYSQMRRSILEAIPLEVILRGMKKEGHMDAVQAVWPRLEAEGLVPAPKYDDAGPYSMQRLYKQAGLGRAGQHVAGAAIGAGVGAAVGDGDHMARNAVIGAAGGAVATSVGRGLARKSPGKMVKDVAEKADDVAAAVPPAVKQAERDEHFMSLSGDNMEIDPEGDLCKAAQELTDARDRLAVAAVASLMGVTCIESFAKVAESWLGIVPSQRDQDFVKSAFRNSSSTTKAIGSDLWKGMKFLGNKAVDATHRVVPAVNNVAVKPTKAVAKGWGNWVWGKKGPSGLVPQQPKMTPSLTDPKKMMKARDTAGEVIMEDAGLLSRGGARAMHVGERVVTTAMGVGAVNEGRKAFGTTVRTPSETIL